MPIYDLLFVGGGLAGLLGARRAAENGAHVALVDHSVLDSQGGLGGFAAFSGAKFSLFPAGSGLAPIVGGEEALKALYRDALGYLATASAKIRSAFENSGEERSLSIHLNLREYQSIVLSPTDIQELLQALTFGLDQVSLFRTSVLKIQANGTGAFQVELNDGTKLSAKNVVVAAGRIGSHLLGEAGCVEQEGKGCDVGVRLEFSQKISVQNLRSLGPDAKILSGQSRTFCLNSPGRIFHYPWRNLKIPGGVVANPSEPSANVGILRRCSDKATTLDLIAKRLTLAPRKELDAPFQATGPDISADPIISDAYGPDIMADITDFMAHLAEAGLIDFSTPYLAHRPLLDWHWPVYSLPGTFETSIPGLYAVGDASGHARGLLQAAAMGWFCAERITK